MSSLNFNLVEMMVMRSFFIASQSCFRKLALKQNHNKLFVVRNVRISNSLSVSIPFETINNNGFISFSSIEYILTRLRV